MHERLPVQSTEMVRSTMLIRIMRILFIGAMMLLAPMATYSGQEEPIPSTDKVPFGQYPGDNGYKHDEYHLDYQKMFGEKMKCACGGDDCRVTIWRHSTLKSPKGIDVLVNRMWLPLDSISAMPQQGQIPLNLAREWAHVCAYEIGGGYTGVRISIPCAIINEKEG
jgi:hypothetical protein